MDDQPSRGDIAICKKGIMGVITRIDGKKCYGVQLYDKTKKWSSTSPRVIGQVNDVDEFLKDK
jgi:hypothetical protein